MQGRCCNGMMTRIMKIGMAKRDEKQRGRVTFRLIVAGCLQRA